jgi:DNA-binding NtrC family response regulator
MKSKEVLLIDDDEMILLLARAVLEEGGFHVITTADGPQGIDIYKVRRPDLVFLDLGLPSLDGMTVLSKIREFDPDAKVIMMTGYGSSKSAEDALRRGAVKFLTKPFTPAVLLEQARLAVGD